MEREFKAYYREIRELQWNHPGGVSNYRHTLVDVRETPIEAITPSGVRTSSGGHELDVLITIAPKPESETWWISHVNHVAEGTMLTVIPGIPVPTSRSLNVHDRTRESPFPRYDPHQALWSLR